MSIVFRRFDFRQTQRRHFYLGRFDPFATAPHACWQFYLHHHRIGIMLAEHYICLLHTYSIFAQHFPINDITDESSHMTPLYSVTQIRAIERSAAQQLPVGTLMQRAGRAAADLALALLAGANLDASVDDATDVGSDISADTSRDTSARAPAKRSVLLLVGPGNNGADALVAGALLADAGVNVSRWTMPEAAVATPESRTTSLPNSLTNSLASPPDERSLAQEQAGTLPFVGAQAVCATHWDLIIDGLFGIGLVRPLAGPVRDIVELVNALADALVCPVLALDVPSGLDADTGAIIGVSGQDIAVHASHTITFIGDKPGLHTCDGRDCAGIVRVERLAIAASHIDSAGPATAHLNDVAGFAPHVRARRQNTHKGSFGNVAVIGGAHGMTGAAILAARAALFSGAGRVFIVFADAGPPYDSVQPELMCRQAHSFDLNSATLVIGPGLGVGDDAKQILARAIQSDSALLIDADGLNLLAASVPLQTLLAQRSKVTILTPHPLEAARLLGISSSAVQADRLAAARAMAKQSNAIVVLKGSGTVIAAPDGSLMLNQTGNAALATGGTGDVLSGLCGALLAQGCPAWESALAAVWLHGKAADDLVVAESGPIGLTAGELIPAIRLTINKIATNRITTNKIAGHRVDSAIDC
jgi:hydroxyethylthiazole kinase-like uncharacterized protein yjeF